MSLDASGARRRFVLLRGLRWLPTGLVLPVLVLILRDRGLSLTEIGIVTAAQGLMVLILELPTGGLADALGRRRVLVTAAVFEAAALGLLLVADTLPLLAGVFALQGVYRALESGPLDAWYVDAAQAADPQADIEGGLAAAGTALGTALAGGTLLGSGLVALHPLPALDPLVTPVLLALALRVLEVGAIATLMTESRIDRSAVTIGRTLRAVPATIGGALSTVRGSRALVALLAVEVLWGSGMVAFETFTPVRLEAVLEERTQAARLLGPTNAVAWAAAALAAAAVPALTRRSGPRAAGAALRVAQGLTVAGIAVAGPLGVAAAYVATLAVHGAANPVHQGMLHRAVQDPGRRATIVSANSLAAQAGGMVGGIALGVLADTTSLTTAILAGAALLAAAAPLYVLVRPPDVRPAGGGRRPLPVRTRVSSRGS